MVMKNPPHPGLHVRSCMEEVSVSVSRLSQDLGVTRQQMHNILAGRSGINAPMAVRFERAFGSTAEMWLSLQAAYDLAQARSSTDVSAVPCYGQQGTS